MTPSRDISRLIEIMARLRDPETGCPWDVEQTFRTIVPYTIEEAYEVADAVERDDRDDLRDELGDLLLQVIYHSRMAEEEGEFVFGDVVEAITTKMIRRHPHVFGDEEARSAGMAKGAWNRIKSEEKRERDERRAARGLPPETAGGTLDAVPRNLPPLAQAMLIHDRMARTGFDWPSIEACAAKVREETEEVLECEPGTDAFEEEVGDLLAAVVNLARLGGVDADRAMARANGKMRKRFAAVEAALKSEGVALEDASLDRMEQAWNAAKNEGQDEH